MEKQGTLIVIAGPTAVGKTDLAIELANHYKTEIISADSRQVYKELRIGTAVPSIDQLNAIPHHFIGCCSIHEYYSAYKFELDVVECLNDLFKKHSYVIMAGGSGLYIDAVCNGIDILPTVDAELRRELFEKYEQEGIESLWKQLKILDPEYYAVVDLKNHIRILKAIEVSLMTGRPYSSHLTGKKKERSFNILKFCINIDREVLYNRINERVDLMLEQGLLEEVKQYAVFNQLNALNTVGYKEFIHYLDGKINLEDATALIKQNTRRYAKRQITWFMRDKDYVWFRPDQIKSIIQKIEG